jgi:uncharacterized damage-inducible protein DinB
MKQELVMQVDKTLQELIDLVASLQQTEINKIPFEGSWTAGQLANHMIKANSGFIDLINGPVSDTQRDPEEMVALIKADFLNFEEKMESPDFVKPEIMEYDKEMLLIALKKIREDALQLITDVDLEPTCFTFEFPVYGALTRLEAINFVVYHTQRHIHQLKNIRKAIMD